MPRLLPPLHPTAIIYPAATVERVAMAVLYHSDSSGRVGEVEVRVVS